MAAFTNEPAGGNPAGVVLDAHGLTDEKMLQIEARLGYSETAFLTREDERFSLRFFSPMDEVNFCGHATIATAVALPTRDQPGTVQFVTPAGPITVTSARRIRRDHRHPHQRPRALRACTPAPDRRHPRRTQVGTRRPRPEDAAPMTVTPRGRTAGPRTSGVCTA